MGLSDAFFWSLTAPLFIRLLERWRERVKRADRRAGTVAMVLAEVHRNPESNPDAFVWTDFFREWEEAPEPMSDEEMVSVMDQWVARTNRKA